MSTTIPQKRRFSDLSQDGSAPTVEKKQREQVDHSPTNLPAGERADSNDGQAPVAHPKMRQPMPASLPRARLPLRALLHSNNQPAVLPPPKSLTISQLLNHSVGSEFGSPSSSMADMHAAGALEPGEQYGMGITLTGPDALTEPHYGVKLKFDAEKMREAGLLRDARFSRLLSPANLPLTMTPTLARGSFGKVRLARRDDGTILAVKEMRTVIKYGKNKYNRSHTRPMIMPAILAEAANTQRLRAIIDQGMAYYDAPHAPLGQSLKSVRQGGNPFEVKDVIEVLETGKVYMVMTREAGDLLTLHERIPEAMRPVAALSLAVQGFGELALLHDQAQVAHLDIKLENFLFNALGQIKLVDFGLSANLQQGVVAQTGRYGSLLAPEMVSAENSTPNTFMRLGGMTDVWSLAASVIDLSNPVTDEIPFSQWPPGPYTKDSLIQATRMISGFADWQNALRPRYDMPMDITRIDPFSFFGSQFINLAVTSPDLCHILLNDALTVNPYGRRPASEIAAKIRQLLPADGSLNANPLWTLMAQIDQQDNNLTQLEDETAKFATWAQAQPRPSTTPTQRSGPRPLPG